jgi:hypothetical protein
MKRSKFTESQIVFALKQAETGVKIEEYYKHRGGMSFCIRVDLYLSFQICRDMQKP